MVKVNIKWGKDTFSADLDQTKDLKTFKEQLKELSTVPVEKQKLLFKGKVLKVDYSNQENGKTHPFYVIRIG